MTSREQDDNRQDESNSSKAKTHTLTLGNIQRGTASKTNNSGLQINIRRRKQPIENKQQSPEELEEKRQLLAKVSAAQDPQESEAGISIMAKINAAQQAEQQKQATLKAEQERQRKAEEEHLAKIRQAGAEIRRAREEKLRANREQAEQTERQNTRIRRREDIDAYVSGGINVHSKIMESLHKETAEKHQSEIKATEAELAVNPLVIGRMEDLPLKEHRRESWKKNGHLKEEDEEKTNKKNKFDLEDHKNSRKSLKTFVFSGEEDEDDFDESFRRHKHKMKKAKPVAAEYKKVIQEVKIPETITVAELAERMTEKASNLVKKLFTLGMVVTTNQNIDADTAELLVTEFGHKPIRVDNISIEDELEYDISDVSQLPKDPVVTIMGHVDHGKTSLLDALRTTHVADGEFGGITQHIGASRIRTKSGKHITFLDTPGHEAFTEMRLRGAQATDIVVLVVAADDGVKEQTVEAINHAKAAGVPIIVAVNKIDRVGANPEAIRQRLLAYEVVDEKLGGDVMFVEVSAKERQNLDKLEEAILLQAEIMALKAPVDTYAKGVVLESRLEQGRGPIATVLVQQGTLKIGDILLAGTSFGKVKKMYDASGQEVETATPSIAVELLGFDQAPSAGEPFAVSTSEKQARNIITFRINKQKALAQALEAKNKMSMQELLQRNASGIKELNVLIKADVTGSAEAVASSLLRLNNEEVQVKIIHEATGGINESDVKLAYISKAIIVGFNVRCNSMVKEMAKNSRVEMRFYSIIYDVIEDIKNILNGMLEPIKREELLGKAEIRQVFKVSGIGKIAGSFVTEGLFKRDALVRVLRDDIVIQSSKIKSLHHLKEEIKEATKGHECGICLDNYEDFKEKDVLECFQVVEEKRIIFDNN